jgi:hypothetical protein
MSDYIVGDVGVVPANSLPVFLLIGHKTKFAREDDCVEFEYHPVFADDKISIIILNSGPWTPTWRKSSFRNQTNKNSLTIGNGKITFYKVLVTCNNQQTSGWLPENSLKNCEWLQPDAD